MPKLAELFNCRTDDFFAEEKASSIDIGDLEKYAAFCKIFEKDKKDPGYVDPAKYAKENSGWEDNCIAFFKSMKKEKCFTPQTVQKYQGCNFETAQEICSALENMGCLTKAPDSKYYVTNAENMGAFISMIKMAKLFGIIDELKGKSADEIDALLDEKI